MREHTISIDEQDLLSPSPWCSSAQVNPPQDGSIRLSGKAFISWASGFNKSSGVYAAALLGSYESKPQGAPIDGSCLALSGCPVGKIISPIDL